jgi:DNA polymerase-3 subunit alpha
MTELLNGEANSNEPKLDSYLRECRLNGIGILPPSAKKANESFEIEGKKNIRFGLCFIKKVTDRSVLALRKNAAYLGSFTNLIINDESGALKKDVMTNLILVGAFDYMGENRACLLEKYLLIKDLIDDYCTQQKKKKEGVKIRKEYSMEFILEQEMNFEFKGREMTSEDCTAKEHELCSCYIVNDPLTPFEELIEDESYRDIMDIEDGRYDKSKPIKLIAVLKTMNIHVMTKGKNAGKEMCFIDVFDTFKEMSCVIFSETFEKVKEKLAPNAVYTFIGKYDGESFVVNDVELLLK